MPSQREGRTIGALAPEAAAAESFDAAIHRGSFAVGGLFPTPIVTARLVGGEALNQDLVATILERRTVEAGVKVSNVDGWHSADFQPWCGPAGIAVLDAAQQIVDRMTLMEMGDDLIPAEVSWRIAAWANVSTQGDGNRPHGHPGAVWSGIYWVDDGGASADPDLGGLLELSDPRGIMPEMSAPHLRFAVKDCLSAGRAESMTPQAGTIILFPSWLIHSVTRFRGGRPRISVAFNFSA